MKPARVPLLLTVAVALAVGARPRPLVAQPSSQAKVILVDEGGSYEVLVHPDVLTVIYFPDKIVKALASDTSGYEVQPINNSLAIRPRANPKAANIAVATESIKVSVVLRIAPRPEEAITQVTFKRADVEAEVERRIAEKVTQRTAELEARIAEMQKTMDARLPEVADGLIASRLLQRRELRKLNAIERNDDNVVVETDEVFFLGEDAYVIFAIENRNKAPYRLASVQLLDGSTDHAGVVRFASDAAESAGTGVIGVVRPGGKGQGVVVVRRSGDLLGKRLDLVLTEPQGRGKVVVDRVVLR